MDIQNNKPDERPAAAVYINNVIVSLNETSPVSVEPEPVYLDTPEGQKIMRRTLAFTLCAAASCALNTRFLVIGQPIDDCSYWTFSDGIRPTSHDLITIEAEMRLLIQKDMPVTVSHLPLKEALEIFSAREQYDLVRQISNAGNAAVKVCRCGDYIDIYRNPLLPRTGLLPKFALRSYHNGLLLIPDSTQKDRFDGPIPKLFKMHDRYKIWGRICGVDSASSLNAITCGGSHTIHEFVRMNELYAEKNFSDVARQIYGRRDEVRVVLLAGPSSSGKTTSAKRLCLHLRILGIKPIVVSLDDYYLHPDKVPRDDDGKPDFECLEALDVPYLNAQLVSLLSGKKTVIPKFDFKTGERRDGETIQLGRRSILVLEGIHALNDKLTPDVPHEKKYKLFVSALTQIKLDEHNRVSSGDNRLLRRIVRDNQFRGMPASRTLDMWPSVQRGEVKHIFPHQNTADSIINSALEYELGVLRLYAEPLLRAVPATERKHAEAFRLMTLLDNFAPISPQHIPGVSVLREFIGGSDFKY
jgi:uridine kinase